MLTDRTVVVGVLRSRGEHDKACQAQCLLPAYVDTEQDAATLNALGVSAATLHAAARAAE